MSGLNGYRGKDGKVYNDWGELTRANNLWDQQQKQNELLNSQNRLLREGQQEQNRLLEEQNRLLEEQRILEEKQREEERRIEREREEEQREFERNRLKMQENIEESRQEHDKEIRLLGLCDEVGINKTIIYKYKININKSEEIMKIDDEIEYLEERKKAFYDLESQITSFKEHDIFSVAFVEEKIDYYNKIKNRNLKPLKDGMIRPGGNNELEGSYTKMSNEIDSLKSLIIFSFIAFVISIFMHNDDISIIEMFLILELGFFVFGGLPCLIIAMYYKNKINKICDTEINKYKGMLPNIKLENNKNEQLEKLAKSVTNEIDKIRELINNLIDQKVSIKNNNVKINLEKFYDFRINHYNPKLEKLIIDLNFDKLLPGETFEIVTKTEAKSNGEVEDYIDYFVQFNKKTENIEHNKKTTEELKAKFDIKSENDILSELNNIINQKKSYNNEINDEKKAIIKINYNSPAKSLKIFVNDEFYNKIENESRVAIELEKGKYNIRFKDGSFFKSSEGIKLDLNDGDYKVINIDCWGSDYKIDVQEKKDMDET